MVYQIYYKKEGDNTYNREYTLFDIEYYLTYLRTDDNVKSWYSELSCVTIVKGIAQFIKESLKDDTFDFDEFVKDATEIQELRGLLYEKHGNKPRELSEARKFHYEQFDKVLDSTIRDFANKYKLNINID